MTFGATVVALGMQRLRYSTSSHVGERLLEWACHPNYGTNIRIGKSYYGGGNGLFATRKITSGDVVFIVKKKTVMSLTNSKFDEDYGEAFTFLVDNGGAGGRKAALAGFLAKEFLLSKFTDGTSYFHQYVNMLPFTKTEQEHFLF